MHDFLYDKWGDIVALLIIYSGLAVVILAPAAKETGIGLVMAGIGFLKLTRTFKSGNGNGNGVPAAAETVAVEPDKK